MKTFNFKAKCLYGGWYTFSILDVPTFIREDQIILFNKPNSPILLPSTIIRGFDNKYFEGDVYLYENKKYILYYRNGFSLYEKERKSISTMEIDLDKLIYLGSIFDGYISDFKYLKQKFCFKYKKHIFTLHDILGMYQREVIIAGTRLRAKPKDILISGMKNIYIGSNCNGDYVDLYKGRVCLVNKQENKIIDLGKEKIK